MLNVDKYREDIMSIGADSARLDCHIAALRGVGMGACRNDLCKACMRESFKWLFSEYEPPRLKNGDGLKPGDWIMVRDQHLETSWRKRKFLCFLDNKFLTVDDGSASNFGGNFSAWPQARLPEEGEEK